MSAQLDLWSAKSAPTTKRSDPLEPTLAEMRHELDCLWRTVALYSGGRTFRAAIAKDLRGALIYQFSQYTLPELQGRRARIVAWLQSAVEIPEEIRNYDASRGHTGASLVGDYPIHGDEACCDADPDYAWDEEMVRQRLRMERELLPQLKAAGWDLPNGVMRLCESCAARLGAEP